MVKPKTLEGSLNKIELDASKYYIDGNLDYDIFVNFTKAIDRIEGASFFKAVYDKHMSMFNLYPVDSTITNVKFMGGFEQHKIPRPLEIQPGVYFDFCIGPGCVRNPIYRINYSPQ